MITPEQAQDQSVKFAGFGSNNLVKICTSWSALELHYYNFPRVNLGQGIHAVETFLPPRLFRQVLRAWPASILRVCWSLGCDFFGRPSWG